jgi:hypothetical protein
MAFSQAMRWAVAATPTDAPATAKANQPKAINRYTLAGQVLRIGRRLGGIVALYRFWWWIRRPVSWLGESGRRVTRRRRHEVPVLTDGLLVSIAECLTAARRPTQACPCWPGRRLGRRAQLTDLVSRIP